MNFNTFICREWKEGEKFYLVTEDVLFLNDIPYSVPGDILTLEYSSDDHDYYRNYYERCFLEMGEAKNYYVGKMLDAKKHMDNEIDKKNVELKILQKKKEELDNRMSKTLQYA